MSTQKETSLSSVRLNNVQFSWPFVFEKDDSNDPKYRVTVIIDKKDKKNLKKIKDALGVAYQEGVKSPKMWNGAKPKIKKNPLHDGDELNDKGEPKGEELKGKMHFTASSNRPVQVIDKSGRVLESDDDFYGGCIGSIIVKAAAYKNQSVGVGLYVNAICKTDDGERFGGGGKVNAQEAFSDLLESDGMFGDDDDEDDDDDDDDIFQAPKKKAKKTSKKKVVDDEDDEDDDNNPFA